MSKTLKQAFTMWAYEPGNIALAARNRDAVNKVLLRKYGDVDLEQFTPLLAERIFRLCTKPQDLKAKAASMLVYVLEYGAEKGWCSRPEFTYDIASPKDKDTSAADMIAADTALLREKVQAAELVVNRIPASEPMFDDHAHLVLDESSAAVLPPDDGRLDPLEGIEFPDEMQETKKETKQEESMENKENKRRGKQPKPVMQIDPETLLVVKGWPSIGEAERGTGIRNITRAAKNQTKAGGYYWSILEDSEEFKRILMAKVVGNPKVKTEKKPKKLYHPKSTPILKSKEEVFDFSLSLDDETTPEPTVSEKPRNAAAAALKVFTDEELLTELSERGFEGELTRMQRFTVGRKEG